MLNLQEFRESAIPDRLTLANVRWVDGEGAVMMLAGEAITQAQKVSSYITSTGVKIRDRYQFASDGGWVAYGCNIDGSSGDVAYFKGVNPRKLSEARGFGSTPKIKTVKYETPAKCPALPILPWMPEEYAQRICEKLGITPLEGEFIWQAILRCNGAIAIVEGFKKALSLIAQGIPAIAIRGIYQWREKGTDILHPILAQFATTGREVYIVFDQDEKLKTRTAVRAQATKLGKALEKRGSVPRFLQWDISLGKGVDDVLYSHRDNAAVWLEVAIASALTLKQYKRQGLIDGALAFIHGMLKRDIPIERVTKGKYLPELPEPRQGALHVIDAPMNSGKTFWLINGYSPHFRDQGAFVIVLSPINSLGKQTAYELEYPHIRRKATAAGDFNIWQDAKTSGGIVMCPDSLHRLPNWVLEHPNLVVILDEADQVCSHLIDGNTLGDRWSEILGLFAYILKRAAETGCIVAAEAGILDATINLISRLSGSDDIRIFQHFKDSQGWDTTLFHGHISSVSGYRARFLEAAGRSRLLYVSASQAECRRMERALSKRYPDKKVVRIDSDTNQQGAFDPFFQNPDQWLQDEQPDILILSPSAKSGVSIEGDVTAKDAYFAAVWGYFPCLDTRTHMQQLGRYRPPVPRFIYCPEFIQASGDRTLFSPERIQARLKKNAEALAIAVALDEDGDDRSEEERAIAQLIETEAIGYYAQNAALQGAMMRCALDCLRDRLEDAGHTVVMHDISYEKCSATAKLWKEIKESLWREDSDYSAALKIDPRVHTVKWAKDIGRKMDATLEDRKIAHKVLLADEFPGMNWSNSDNWYECIYAHDGEMVRGVRLQAQAENLEATKLGDRAYAEKLNAANIKALHHLPKRAIKALVLSHTGIMVLLDGSTYSNTDPRAIAIKRTALQYAQEIEYWLGLHIKPDQTPIEVCHKLLKKLGLEKTTKNRVGAISEVSRPGKRGEKRDRTYQVNLAYSSYRVQLLEASHRKLSESVSTIFKEETNILENHGHRPKIPQILPHLRHYMTEHGRAFIEYALASAQNAAERLAIWQELPSALRRSLSVVSPNLCPVETIAS